MKILKFIFVWVFLLTFQYPLTAQYHLIVMSGQSNMQGIASRKDYKNYHFPKNVTYINFGYNGANFEIDQEHFGPEIGLAETLNKVYPNEKFILFKYAAGGASLLDFKPLYDRELAKLTQTPAFEFLYLKMIQKLDSVMNVYHCKPEVMLWMQGERDAKFTTAAEMYAVNFKNFITSIRNQLDIPNLPFVYGMVNPPADKYPGLETVREAQKTTISLIPKTYLIRTDDLTKNEDQLHYDASGQIKLGKRFAEAIIKNQLISVRK